MMISRYAKLLCCVIFLIPWNAFSHGGGTDSSGGHYNRKTEGYHYHGRTLTPSYGDVWVNGYFRKDGTYVRGHWRTRPDGNPYNHYSSRGLVIPNISKTLSDAYRKDQQLSGGQLAAWLLLNSPSVPTQPRVKSPPKQKLPHHESRFLKIVGGAILIGFCAIMVFGD